MIYRLPSPLDVAQALKDYHVSFKSGDDDLWVLAQRFIQLKRRLGHRYQTESRRLQAFIRFMHDQGVGKATELSVPTLLSWFATRHGVHPLTRRGDVSAVSVFMDHLRAIGKIRNNMCCFLKERYQPTHRSHIFTQEDLKRIFRPSMDVRRGVRLRARIYFVIYACALRVSEAAHLKMRHLNLAEGTLFIEKSKWQKDRLLPLHERVIGKLKHYIGRRRKAAPPDAPLFVNLRRKAYAPKDISSQFNSDLKVLGLFQPTRDTDGIRYLSTRIHGLRHTFAVNRLLKWYRQGADVQAMLPFLTTYMGHSEVRYTQVYLNVTGLVLREAHERFAGRWEKEFPLQP